MKNNKSQSSDEIDKVCASYYKQSMSQSVVTTQISPPLGSDGNSELDFVDNTKWARVLIYEKQRGDFSQVKFESEHPRSTVVASVWAPLQIYKVLVHKAKCPGGSEQKANV